MVKFLRFFVHARILGDFVDPAAQAEAHDRQADASLAEGDALGALIALQGALGGGWTD
ncbi:MAG: hypothetical protein KGL54_01310 [Sphingomonadales bacterium]|nr:hypothetical protein [Sphingomonadales bacterium]